METKDWIFLALTVLQTLYAAVTYHNSGETKSPSGKSGLSASNVLVLFGFTLLSWAAFAADYFSRPELPEAQNVDYGIDGPNQFHATIAFRNWKKYENKKVMLITRTVFADRDRLSDDWIAKSISYSISEPIIRMTAVTSNQMRFAPNMLNLIEYDCVVLPAEIVPEQVRNLSDVSKLGGKVLTISQQGIPMGQAAP